MSLYDLLDIEDVQIPHAEGEIYNPDIPVLKSTKPQKIQDNYYRDMNINRLVHRNGDGYTFDAKHKGKLPNTNPKEDKFLIDGAIDPRKIRQMEDPRDELPPSFDYGTLYDTFELPVEATVELDSHGLILKAAESFNNYKNRFNLDPTLQILKDLTK